MSDSCKCQGEEGLVKKLLSKTYAGFGEDLFGKEEDWAVEV